MSRKPRAFRESRKILPTREPYDLVLIVCEGARTEPDYFRALIQELRLSTANVEIVGEECGSSPQTIVQFALDKFQSAGGYNKVFCVFDRDSHSAYQAAVDRCHALRKSFDGKPAKFVPITSTPCFEFWLILHFEDTDRPYASSGNRSVGENVVRDLQRHIPGYAKGARDTYKIVRSGQDDAIRRAEKGRAQGLENPYTIVDEVVTYLKAVRR